MSKKAPHFRVSSHTRKLLKEKGYEIQYACKGHYSKKMLQKRTLTGSNSISKITVSLDYDTLQYLGIVRSYVQKKHNITISVLELMLFLYPLGVWSKQDYNKFPHRYNTRNIEVLINKGYIEPMFAEHSVKSSSQTFRLSRVAKRAVRDFYEYIHGEKTLPEETRTNPLLHKNASIRDLVKANAIMEINRQIRGNNQTTKQHKKTKKRIVKQIQENPLRQDYIAKSNQKKKELERELQKKDIVRRILEKYQ